MLCCGGGGVLRGVHEQFATPTDDGGDTVAVGDMVGRSGIASVKCDSDEESPVEE